MSFKFQSWGRVPRINLLRCMVRSTLYIAQSVLRTPNRAELSDVDPRTPRESDLVESIGKHGVCVLLKFRGHLDTEYNKAEDKQVFGSIALSVLRVSYSVAVTHHSSLLQQISISLLITLVCLNSVRYHSWSTAQVLCSKAGSWLFWHIGSTL